MAKLKQRKVVAAYAAGILVLVACIAAAWLLPEAYGRWQDKRQIGQVKLSKRESIKFLDGNSLDQIGRWKALSEYDEFYWHSGEMLYTTLETDLKEFKQKCMEEIGNWCDSGLLPLDKENLSVIVEQIEGRVLWVNSEFIPLGIFSYHSPKSAEEVHINAVMDLDTKKLYYVSVTGEKVREYMAQQMGYDSLEGMQEFLAGGQEPLAVQPDISDMDFASVCGANACSVVCDPGRLELEAELQFDTFLLEACRRVVYNQEQFGGYGYGIAVMFGCKDYPELFMDSLYSYNAQGEYEEVTLYGEEQMSTELWLEYMSFGGNIAAEEN